MVCLVAMAVLGHVWWALARESGSFSLFRGCVSPPLRVVPMGSGREQRGWKVDAERDHYREIGWVAPTPLQRGVTKLVASTIMVSECWEFLVTWRSE